MASRTGSVTSQSTSSYNRIPVMITDRKDDRYNGDPMETPEFVRRGSYYQTGLDRPEYRYLEASDVRRQVREAPSLNTSVGIYPKPFSNHDNLSLTASPPYSEFPIKPSAGTTGRNYRGGDPGPVRAFYNDRDRSKVDVGYHDSTKPPVAPRAGKIIASTPFSLATYREGPTYTEIRTPLNEASRAARHD